MSARLVSLIYFYLISALSLLLFIIGIYNAINYAVNSTQYEKYPLPYEDSCEYFEDPIVPIPLNSKPAPQIKAEESLASPSSIIRPGSRELCLERVEKERQKQKINDMKNTFFFTIVGAFLFGIHFPIALKRSNESK